MVSKESLKRIKRSGGDVEEEGKGQLKRKSEEVGELDVEGWWNSVSGQKLIRPGTSGGRAAVAAFRWSLL